jgi:hypothetical protein
MDEALPGLREIRMFVAVYEERSFTAAAAREFATQPGASQHVKQIEEALGVQLFDRLKTERLMVGIMPMRSTPEGCSARGPTAWHAAACVRSNCTHWR